MYVHSSKVCVAWREGSDLLAPELPSENHVDWKFYFQLLKSMIGKDFIDAGTTCWLFLDHLREFTDLRQYTLFSVCGVPLKLEVREGYHTFARRFLVYATKSDYSTPLHM